MQWISNARYKQELADGSIFELKESDIRISIHKIVGCGGGLYLTCRDFGFVQRNLNTEDFNEAVKKAKSLILKRANFLSNEALKFYDDKSENEFVRY